VTRQTATDAHPPRGADIGDGGLPVLLRGSGVRALVVGGGAVATRKVASLLEAGAAHVRVVAPRLSAELREAAASAGARVELVERGYEAGDLAPANVVIAATDVRAVNALVARDADTLGRLVCVTDAPDEGTWTAMATHRAGPLVVGVSAGGVPTAGARIRDAIAERFGRRYADAVARLAAVRARLIEHGEGERWREAAGELTGVDFCAAVEDGELTRRLERLEASSSWA